MDRTEALQNVLQNARQVVLDLVEESVKLGFGRYSSHYSRGENRFSMSNGESGRGVTLMYREWFRERGLKFTRDDGLTIRRVIDGEVAKLGIEKDKRRTASW
jgi:hypothetical protein